MGRGLCPFPQELPKWKGRGFIPPISSGRLLPGLDLPPATPALRDPAPPPLTVDVELDGSLRGHLSSLEFHLTGEVGAMVLGSRGEGEHRGAKGLWVHSIKGGPRPGEMDKPPPITDWRQGAGQVCGAARLQRLQKADVGFLCQG